MSLRVFDGFKFAHTNTPIHMMDPRAKFLMTLGIFSIALMSQNPIVLLLVFILQIPIVLLAKTTRRWAASMRAGVFIAGLIFGMNFIFEATLGFAMAMTLRFLSIMSSFSLFFMTTSPDDLGLAMERAKVPYEISFTFTTAVRLVPTMALDAQTVIDAQRSRGLELDKGNLMKRIRNYIPILIPLIVSAIRRSIELAEALESRAFGATEKRESLVVLHMRASDYAVIVATAVIVVLSAYAHLFLSLPALDLSVRLRDLWPF
jgi:energy-coupling factor transport system permease protein